MSIRTRSPIILIIGLLFIIWLYFTIHQFWNASQIQMDSPIILVYNNNMQKSHNYVDLPVNEIPSQSPTKYSQTATDPPSIQSFPPTIIDAPTLEPSRIVIEDKYLSRRDETELRFEFENDNHIYLYDVPYFANDNIFIMSMVTNSSEISLSNQLQTLDEISCVFRNTYFLIFESNSLDETPEMLRNWTLNSNNDSRHHSSFCGQYRFGFHRQRIHSYSETGDALHGLYPNKTSKSNAISSIATHMHRNTDLVMKHILFGDEHVMDAMEQFKKDVKTRFLSRIEKYTFYRNMLLSKMNEIYTLLNAKYAGFTFDYLMVLDLDIFGFQQRVLLSELYYYHGESNGNVILCSHGTLAHNFYMDTFASVDTSNQWYYEYQRNNTFENVTTQYLTQFPRIRFEMMRSCFGGVIIYSNVHNIIESECNYNLIWSNYDVPTSVQQEVVNAQSLELTLFADKMRDWRAKKRSKNRRYKRRDNHICEHIPFHYCLYYAYNYSVAIAKYAYLFYEPMAMYKFDANQRLIEQTPSPTSHSLKETRKKQRRARLKRERERRMGIAIAHKHEDIAQIFANNKNNESIQIMTK